MSSPKPYNPLDKSSLGNSVADALLSREWVPLQQLEPFKGAGIYAIYYVGDFKPYDRLVQLYRSNPTVQIPIYVGKAVPKGTRKGLSVLAPTTAAALYARLREHAESINMVENLRIEDFYFRYLVVDDVWIPLGEALLIARFAPIWNQVIDGFGNHDPGSKRYEGMRPRWDVLHPGRLWAEKCAPRPETAEQIGLEVIEHLRSSPILSRYFPNP